MALSATSIHHLRRNGYNLLHSGEQGDMAHLFFFNSSNFPNQLARSTTVMSFWNYFPMNTA